jgi:hypothetical protein
VPLLAGLPPLRALITWRLDRNRLAAIVTAAVPGIPIVETARL